MFEHGVGTQGLATMAIAMGVLPYGMPSVRVVHKMKVWFSCKLRAYATAVQRALAAAFAATLADGQALFTAGL